MAAVRRGNFPPQQRQQNQPPPQDGANVTGQDPMLKIASAQPGYQTQSADNRRTKSGKFTMAQLRQTDSLVPLQSGTNQFDSQKGKTGFGMPRNTATKVEFADQEKRYKVEELTQRDNLIRLQSGTNKFDSQKGMTGFGSPRDVKGKHLKRIWELEFPEEEIGQPVNLAPQQNNGVYQQSPQQYNNSPSAGQYQQQQFQNQQQYQQRPQQQAPQQGFNQPRPSPQQQQFQQQNLRSPPAFR
ncbi:hypothetical protein M3Y97_00425000 [Aphelenchoides bicaudatus]|nr:hypothetical protein M3Y97_00425000 [Aphelenchoides bicaudatus]